MNVLDVPDRAILEAIASRRRARLVELLEPPLHLPFDGMLSLEEQRMIDEGELEKYPMPEWWE